MLKQKESLLDRACSFIRAGGGNVHNSATVRGARVVVCEGHDWIVALAGLLDVIGYLAIECGCWCGHEGKAGHKDRGDR